jgi:hypothetical protein
LALDTRDSKEFLAANSVSAHLMSFRDKNSTSQIDKFLRDNSDRPNLALLNVSWARKKLAEFRDRWTDEDSKRLLGKLELRVEHAAAKWQKRDDERAAAKAAGTTKGRRKSETPGTARPAPNLDPWEG